MQKKNEILQKIIKGLSDILKICKVNDHKTIHTTKFMSELKKYYNKNISDYIHSLEKETNFHIKNKFNNENLKEKPISYICDQLKIESIPNKITILIDSLDKLKFCPFGKKVRIWQQELQNEIQMISFICEKLYKFGLDIQLILVSSIHIDLEFPLYQMNFIDEESLVEIVSILSKLIYRLKKNIVFI